jgi:hypothetical protein
VVLNQPHHDNKPQIAAGNVLRQEHIRSVREVGALAIKNIFHGLVCGKNDHYTRAQDQRIDWPGRLSTQHVHISWRRKSPVLLGPFLKLEMRPFRRHLHQGELACFPLTFVVSVQDEDFRSEAVSVAPAEDHVGVCQ